MSSSSLLSALQDIAGWQYASCQPGRQWVVKAGCKSRPWQRPMHLSLPPRVGRELPGKRRGRGARYPGRANHAERDQVAVAVVTDCDDFFRFRRRALEIRIA